MDSPRQLGDLYYEAQKSDAPDADTIAEFIDAAIDRFDRRPVTSSAVLHALAIMVPAWLDTAQFEPISLRESVLESLSEIRDHIDELEELFREAEVRTLDWFSTDWLEIMREAGYELDWSREPIRGVASVDFKWEREDGHVYTLVRICDLPSCVNAQGAVYDSRAGDAVPDSNRDLAIVNDGDEDSAMRLQSVLDALEEAGKEHYS